MTNVKTIFILILLFDSLDFFIKVEKEYLTNKKNALFFRKIQNIFYSLTNYSEFYFVI